MTAVAQQTQSVAKQKTDSEVVGPNADIVQEILLHKVIEYTPLGEKGTIKLSIPLVKKMIAVPTKTGQLPSDRDCLEFIMLCRARRLDPWAKDCYMLGYDNQDGTPSFSQIVAIQALFKRAEVNEHYDGIESGIIVMAKDGELIERYGDLAIPGDTLLGGWAKVWRKDRKYPVYQRLQLSTFDQKRGHWNKDKAGQICKCAEAAALRQSFPSDVGGLYLDVELESFAASIPDASAAARKFDLPAKGPIDLETLTTPAPEAQPGAKTTEPAKTTADNAAGGQGDAGTSAQVQNGDATKTPQEGPPAGVGDGNPDAKLETWEADVDLASTHGKLDQIAELAKQNAPQAILGQIMDMIGQKRATIGKKNGK